MSQSQSVDRFKWIACGAGLGVIAYHAAMRLRKPSCSLNRRRIRLTYLDIKGAAEPIRLALHLGKVPFEDRRVTCVRPQPVLDQRGARSREADDQNRRVCRERVDPRGGGSVESSACLERLTRILRGGGMARYSCMARIVIMHWLMGFSVSQPASQPGARGRQIWPGQ